MIDVGTVKFSRVKQFYLPVIGQCQRPFSNGKVELTVQELFTEV